MPAPGGCTGGSWHTDRPAVSKPSRSSSTSLFFSQLERAFSTTAATEEGGTGPTVLMPMPSRLQPEVSNKPLGSWSGTVARAAHASGAEGLFVSLLLLAALLQLLRSRLAECPAVESGS